MSPLASLRLPTTVLATVEFLLAESWAVLAQREPAGIGAETAASTPWYVQSITAAVITLVIGGLLIAIAPDGTRRQTDRVLEQPGAAFVSGVVSLVAVIGVAFVLAITGIGIVLAIPLLLIFALLALVTGVYGYLAVGRLASDSWPLALGVAIVVSALVGAVPVLGSIAGFVISSIGLGVVVMDSME
ncbi:hypothetical protein [Natrinema salsiterrestre]|uniref:DUF8173 domain-containing protein n=1 Tax=Natrinema salsiterrestre TaxID=2950540 RepID=A0A9Q4L3F5_9EURY|nr:hypothetical protein [Natrinema salsiterrestre]MDF9744626.1 hypothetical protein [Natrinema salsiterrestre]